MSVTEERGNVKEDLSERVDTSVFRFVVSPEPPIEEESGIEISGRVGPGAGGWDSHVGGLVVEWLADVIVERRLLFLFPPFLPTADSGRTDPAVDPAVPEVVPLLLKWLEGPFEVESEGVNDKFLLSTTDCGTGIS